MERLDKLASYFNEKQRRKLDKIAKETGNGIPIMSFEEIQLSCMENNGYETPELNDKLYLHMRGFHKIENLDRFTGCKAIWLDSNGFVTIENLHMLTELRCLYLSKNLINRIDGLSTLSCLTILDLSNNRLTMIDNLSCCPILQTVNLAHNYLATPESILHLQECPSITNIDITNNKLEADESVMNVLKYIPSLVALSINGNEVTKLPTFRKRMIAGIPKLGYLDRPIDEQERLFASAFVEGGAEAEAAAREQWKAAQTEKRINEAAAHRAWQLENIRQREQARAEGRSLITEMSPEEVAEREREAQAAAEAEKRMLDLGIGRVAAKYWQNEGSGRGDGVDALEAATQQVLAEEEKAVVISDRVEELPDEPAAAVSEPVVEDAAVVQVPNVAAAAAAAPTADEILTAGVQEADREAEAAPAAAAAAALKEQEEGEKARQVLEQKEQREREQRVDESFTIYKRQLEQQKSGKPLTPAVPTSSTWDAPTVVPTVTVVEPRPLYWSEVMDIELAKLVRPCVFMFDDIADRMRELARKGVLGKGSEVHVNPTLLTEETCRLRWSQLDATQWSEVSPDSAANETNFKVCITSEIIGTGHGSQPSYQALASLAAGSMPKYLTVPTSFPTVQDMNVDDLDNDYSELD